ncbi:outer membrane beta-barrel protein [Aliikangiella coralliicola]|uniref:Porin family protein n=1 Tax=Aliikangiella coralliicola TaxID=2592383 RepID=A0A545UC51_9GAMM|nr:outer membrane beta-barrel protein [Aliikangiella coralliicola]TQV87045.1 porin family protein [Aliikangiella coralliicola]
MRKISLLLASLACSLSVSAEEAFYVSIDLGRSSFDVKDSYFPAGVNGYSEKETFENIAAGWRTNSDWIFELGYELDHVIDAFDDLFTDSSISNETEFDGLYLKVAKRIEVGDFYFTPAVGYMNWELNADPGPGSGDVIKDGNSLFYELAFEKQLSQSWSMGLKYRVLNEDEFDVESFGINATFSF